MSRIPAELEDRAGLFLPYSTTPIVTVGEVRELETAVEHLQGQLDTSEVEASEVQAEREASDRRLRAYQAAVYQLKTQLQIAMRQVNWEGVTVAKMVLDEVEVKHL